MKHFTYQAPDSYEGAEKILQDAKPGQAAVMAGGTDLLGVLKGELLPKYPETVVALRDIPGTEYIKEEEGMVKIGLKGGGCGGEQRGQPPDPQPGHHRRQPMPGCALLVLPFPGPGRRDLELYAQGRRGMLRDPWR